MKTHVLATRPYTSIDRAACLAMFASNVPDAFAPSERADYETFLADEPADYFLVLSGASMSGAYGFSVHPVTGRGRIRWIMTHAQRRGQGVGTYMIRDIRTRASRAGVQVIDIAASHVSAPFFARHGAMERSRTPDGWGPGLDRVDMEWRVVPVRGFQ